MRPCGRLYAMPQGRVYRLVGHFRHNAIIGRKAFIDLRRVAGPE
jgi:hypothetical protein